MNLHQFRVLSALFRLPAEFTTADIMRETGVSAEVVRKTYQRYGKFFTVVREESSGHSGGKRKVRRLTPTGRDELALELSQSRSLLPAPSMPRGAEGEPLGLMAAERVLYDLLPASQREERALLLREARSHLDFAEQERGLADEQELSDLSPALSATIELRLDALRRILEYAEVLQNAEAMLLDKGVPQREALNVGGLAGALLNALTAQDFANCRPAAASVGGEFMRNGPEDISAENSGDPEAAPAHTRLAGLLSIQGCASEEANRIVHALLALAKEPAWRKALGIPSRFWTTQEEGLLESQFSGPHSRRSLPQDAFEIAASSKRTVSRRTYRWSGSRVDPVVIVGAARTPMGGMLGDFAGVPATHLGGVAIKGALDRSKVDPVDVDEVLMGCCLMAGLKQAPARQAAHFAGLPWEAGATTLIKMCGSAMKTTMLGHDNLIAGSHDVVITGGMESMTNAPYLVLKGRTGYRLGHGDRLMDHMFYDGLEDAYEEGRSMGTFAEECAQMYQFTREAQDAFAAKSVKRAQRASNDGTFEAEITVVMVKDRKGERAIAKDQAPFSVSVDKISTLKPAFRKDGTVTAATSSSISDGAAALVLMLRSHAEKKGIQPLAIIKAHATHSQDPHLFTTAPVGAIRKVLEKTGWAAKDVDLWEINEAFAVVTMAAMRDHDLPHDKVNVNGGACALGHPIGASGARIVVTLLHALKKHGLKKGVASLCIGGGEATAMSIELI